MVASWSCSTRLTRAGISVSSASIFELHVAARAGRIVNEKALRQRVFYSGVANEIRKEVWKFLLGLYPMSSTAAERADILKQKRLHYGRIKAQWTTICPEQAAK